ncbi:hypothetical protein JHD46_05280 [Sulfurimonas sp. SAG-AH-194-C20]|nr:hypothetical protein [Sulfurimonas sp. SAG-AH-194-C20]MDF1879051.1 hypothetical protein [Sulfurimonas sp. SAG-AH-194-C20]
MKQLSGAKIKHYNTLISKAKLEREQLSQEYRTLQSKMDKTNNLLKRYEEALVEVSASSTTLIVSEHALLRYLERVYKLDLSKIEIEIASKELFIKVQELGNGTYSCEGDFSAKVVDGVIVTVLDSKKNHTTKRKKKSVRDRSTTAKPKSRSPLQRDLQEYYEEVE